MKIYILVLTTLIAHAWAVPSEQHRAELNNIINNCMKDSKASEKDISEYHQGKMSPDKIPDSVKCFTKCFMEKVGLMDAKTGEFSPENLKTKFAKYINDGNRKDLDEALVKCATIKGTTPCDTAFQISGCMANVKMQVDD